jgi:hypothetical protein
MEEEFENTKGVIRIRFNSNLNLIEICAERIAAIEEATEPRVPSG